MTGIVVPVAQRYEKIALHNLARLRRVFHSNLPVEVWEVGKEISDSVRGDFSRIGSVTFRNAADHCGAPDHWKGVQVKALAARHTSFDRFLLCDADVTFFRNPELPFAHRGFLDSGAYFFRDLAVWKFRNLGPSDSEKFSSRSFFVSRRSWLLGLLPSKVDMFPREWAYMYDVECPTRPVYEAYMEAGAVYFDRAQHQDTLETVFALNDNHEETYRYILGDKETWWIACCIRNKAFATNSSFPRMIRKLTQFYGLLPFYVQK